MLVLGEIVLRYALSQGLVISVKETNRVILLREYRPQQATTVQPTLRQLMETDGLEAKNVRFAVDADGFIEPSQRHSDPDFTIAFLGGSTTECLYLDEEKRFPNLVALEIERIHKVKVNALNGGTSGGNSLHSINKLINVVAPKKPQVVVLMHAINDLITLAYFGTYWNADRRGNLAVIEQDMASPTYFMKVTGKRTLPGYFTLAMIAFDYVNPKVDDEFASQQHVFNANLQREDDLTALFRRQLKLFIATARSLGSMPVLMTQANRIENDDPFVRALFQRTRPGLDYDRWVRVYARFNQEIRNVAKEEQIPLVDLAKSIPQTKEYAYDPVHLTERGSQVVAEQIVNMLNETVDFEKVKVSHKFALSLK
jgi:lysophospholipase L1-like esterase